MNRKNQDHQEKKKEKRKLKVKLKQLKKLLNKKLKKHHNNKRKDQEEKEKEKIIRIIELVDTNQEIKEINRYIFSFVINRSKELDLILKMNLTSLN